MEGAYVDPQSGERTTLGQHIAQTLEVIKPHAAVLEAEAACEQIRQLVASGMNDAVWLRQIHADAKSLNEMVRQQCLRWAS